MGMGLYLTGALSAAHPAASAFFPKLESWLEENGEEPFLKAHRGKDRQDQPAFLVSFHPSAEDVEFILPEPGKIVVSAKTSTTGPGYHIYLCDLLHRVGDDLGIAWDDPDQEAGTGDETGFFHHGDADAVQREMMQWLASMAKIVLENAATDDVRLMIGMPMGTFYPHGSGHLTPLGPRDTAWFRQVAEDSSTGLGFFPWLRPEVNGSFYLGRALCEMWSKVRWRVPLFEEEGDLLMNVHLDLERAYRDDPTLDFPWREWDEVLDYVEAFFGYVEYQEGSDVEDVVHRRAAQVSDQPRIGYRRQNVQVHLAGWSMEIPGSMAEQWSDDGQSWSAWDGDRTVWFSSFSIRKKDQSNPTAEETLNSTAPLPEGDPIIHERDGLIGKAIVQPHEENGKNMWNLHAFSARPGEFALCNIYFSDPADREWAIGTWQSLK